MPKIIFFNHFHRGDLHTHKEFIRQIKNELPDFEFGYLHNNPAKLIEDLGIPTTGLPGILDKKEPYYLEDKTELYINTWVGCDWDVFCKHGGINMHTLYEQWSGIFDTINEIFDTNLELKPTLEDYLPRIDYTKLDLSSIDNHFSKVSKRVLVCNNVPQSDQSFVSDMADIINTQASIHPNIEFICTNKFETFADNIVFTGDIINSKDGVDLQEISYLSTKCDIIIGKNSGPYVFCETYDNYMDGNKTFVSFNMKNPGFDDIKETMSNGLDIKCKYITVPVLNANLSENDFNNVTDAFHEVLNEKA